MRCNDLALFRSEPSDKIRLIKSGREKFVDSEILNLFEVDLSDISRIYVGPDN